LSGGCFRPERRILRPCKAVSHHPGTHPESKHTEQYPYGTQTRGPTHGSLLRFQYSQRQARVYPISRGIRRLTRDRARLRSCSLARVLFRRPFQLKVPQAHEDSKALNSSSVSTGTPSLRA
jgi:hypothetical protein